MGNLFQAAKQLSDIGFRILPADLKTKKPGLWLVDEDKSWKRYQSESTSDKIQSWFSDREDLGLCAVCGAASGVVVLDIDSPGAYEVWREELGDVLDETWYAVSPRATEPGVGHYYFLYPSAAELQPFRGKVKNQSHKDDSIQWDIKADGGIVKLPPSFGYEWIRSPWEGECEPTPIQLLKVPEICRPAGRVAIGKGVGPSDDGVRSLMARTVETLGQNGRNNDVTKLAGHLAKAFPIRDMYDAQMELIWYRIDKEGDGTYTREEFEKTRESIWNTERAKGRGEVSEDNGYLIGTGSEIKTQIKVQDELIMAHWADFDIEALGVVPEEADERVYLVRLNRQKHGPVETVLSSKDITDQRRLTSWLGQFGCGILPPDNMWPRAGAGGERLRRYLEHQNPPSFKTVNALGWYPDEGFICHEGVITPRGLRPHNRLRPHPHLKHSKAAPYRYGFEEGWKDALNQVLTFHDPLVCSVFGSWTISVLLKPQIMRRISQFPFMAIQAPSGSGKSTGFFPIMMQLIGNQSGQVIPTKAALRDYIASHQSGIVWIDDLDDTEYITELLRSATVGGSLTKKSEDRSSQVEVKLVAGISISGEHLGFGTQKALRDRAIHLHAPDPKGRMSQLPGREHKYQWDDIVALRAKCDDDFTRWAGSIVQAVLAHEDEVAHIEDLFPENRGRWGDKVAVIRLGAKILSKITDDPIHMERVETWIAGDTDTGSENTLTLEILPAAIRHTPEAYTPMSLLSGDTSPVLIRDGEVWFSPVLLAAWWSDRNRGRVKTRVASPDALAEQARSMGLGGVMGRRQLRSRKTDGGRKFWYWSCGPELSELLIDRAEGATP